MTDSLKISDKGRQLIAIALFFLALPLRMIVMSITVEGIADGPTRALQAYLWAKSPSIITSGSWLPGYTYVTGIFSFIIEDPWLSTRIFNTIVGSLTVSIYFLLLLRIYGSNVALISSAILLFLPIHIGMSATSLTGISFLFSLLAGICFFIKVSNAKYHSSRYLYLFLACLSVIFAAMTRYEAWVLLPVFPAYYWWKTGRIKEAIVIALILFILPLLWMLGNYMDTGGNFLPIYEGATKDSMNLQISFLQAISIITNRVSSQISLLLVVLASAGIITQLLDLIKTYKNKTNKNLLENSKEKLLHLMICSSFWFFIIILTMKRGETLRDRFLLFGIVISIPFATLLINKLIAYIEKFYKSRLVIVLLTFTIITIVLLNRIPYRPLFYGVQHPNSFNPSLTNIKKASEWLQTSPYRDQPVIITKMNWSSLFIPLYLPSIRSKYAIIYEDNYRQIAGILERVKPTILITQESSEDRKYKKQIEREIGIIKEENLIYKDNSIKLYYLNINETDNPNSLLQRRSNLGTDSLPIAATASGY